MQIDGLPYTIAELEVRVSPGAKVAHMTLLTKEDGPLLSLALTREEVISLAGLLVKARRALDCQ